MEPSKRTLPVARAPPRTEAALMTRGFSQLYLSLGDPIAGRLARGAALSQAAGAADLARHRGHGARRRAVALRPAAARRRAEAGAGQGCDAAGGVGMHALAAAHRLMLSLLGAASHALAVQPDEILADPALEARARALSKRAALHGLPEPVDRRFRCAARPRPAHPGARAAAGRRQRPAGARLPGRSATASSCCCEPRLHWRTALLWLAPPVC